MATVTAGTARWSEVPDRDDQSAMPTPMSPGCVLATLTLLVIPVVVVAYAVVDWVVGWVL